MKIPVNLFRLGTTGIIMAFIMMIPMDLSATTKYYVDINRPDDSGNGTSWATAKKHLQSALHLVSGYGGADEIEIWVAAGTYNPSYEIDGGYGDYSPDRHATFDIPSGVAVYGGFTGSEDEVDLSQRDWANNVTILSGDIDGNDAEGDRSGNSYHVVSFYSVNQNTVLDGFTITGGNADGDDEASNGGGIFNDFSYANDEIPDGGVNIRNCIISGNSAANNGGGMYNHTFVDYDDNSEITGHAKLTNCVISGNRAGVYGGGIYGYSFMSIGKHYINHSLHLRLINCTITGNSAVQGGGVYHVWDSDYPSVGGATSTVINCIFWNNHGGDSFVDSDLALNTIRGHEEDFDPNFLEPIGPENAPTKGGDFHLIEGSPAIDSGTSDGVDLPDLDLDGNPRIQNDIIDMGAFEGGVPPPLYMVDADSPDGGNGEDWDHAFNKLQDALMVSAKNAVIWVAAGTYYPDEGAHQSDNERLSTFNIPNGVKVYGGFDGTDGFEGGRQETELSDRDPEIYEVILSGDIDGNDAEGDRSGNSYHVVSFGGDAQEGTIFDGFTITGGNADGDSELAEGGGIRSDGSPELSNLIITGNSASSKGGGIYCSGGYLTNCTISNNSSGGNGGGIYIRLPTDITDCEVINNSIDPEIYSGHGGGIYNGEGGTFTRCIISGNSISGEYSKGGGIYNRKVYSSFKYCIISGNVLTGAYGVGGGIYNLGSKISIINVTLTGNRAEYGGGMAGSNHDKGKMKANRAKVINSIFWNNGPSDQAYIGANAIVINKQGVPEYWEDEYMYSNVEGSGGSGDSWNGDTGIGVDNGSNIDSDPFFVEAVNILTVPTSSGDFNLTQNSEESIDTGTLDTDNDGEDDIFEYLGSGPDMGAYEYTGMVLAADDEPPIVESLCPNSEGKCPDREADDFDVDTDLIITFQEPVEEGVGSITINTEGRDPVTIAVPSEEDAFNHATVTDRIVRIVLGDDLEQEVEYSVTVEENTFQDLNENSFAGIGDSEDDRWRFFIDNEPPQVSFNPAGGSTNNAQETNITLSFGEVVFMVDGGAELTDENVDALIVLEDASSDADIEFEATVANGDETVITVDPTGSFTSEQRVYVVIGSTVKDAAGNQIEGSDATFSIADVEDPTAVFDPANSATGVAPNADVTVTLSEAVTNGDGSEITDDNVATLITLKSDNNSGSDIPFSAEINDAKNVISIDPLTNYQSQQVVYVSLDAGVQDAAENEVSGTLNSTFTTANVEAPTVTVELSDDDIVFPTSLSTIGITVRFNEEVSGFELSDISFDPSENGSASDFSEILSGREYSANITLLGGTVSVSIPEGVATTADGLNISNSTSNMLALIYDATAPTIDYLPANGDVDVALDLDNITLTFSKRVKKLIEGSAEEITADNLWDVITLKKAARSEDTDFDNDGGTDVDYTATVEIAELETGGFGHKITLDPDSDFLDDKSEYYVSVNSDKIVDYSSVELLHAVSSATFSTANNLPPEITSFRYVVDEEQPISHRPGEFLTDVPNASDLIIVFDEDVRNNQDEAGFITLYKILGEELNQQVAIIYVSDSEIVTGNNSPEIRINLPDDLDSFADYFLTISPNSFKDMSDDMFGGINDPNAWTFRTLDETPPALVDHSPNPDDHEIFETEGDSPIELIFDEPVVVKHGNIEIYDSEYTLVETIDITDAEKIEILDVAPDVVRISPENLVSDSEYHILIVKAEEAVGALVDIAFPPNPLADIEDRSRIFIQTSDMRPPNILNYSLTENNALEPSIFNADWEMEVFGINDNVDINSHIVIRFDEDLFKNGGVLATNENIDEVIALKINEKTGSDIQFGASISDDSRMITLQPDELLVGGTTYYLQVKADYLEDAYGNDLHEDRWASFTTADTDPPLLVSTDPMNGDENVDIKSNIILQFDKNVTVEGRLIIVNTATNKTHTTILLTNEYKVLVEENVITIDKKTSLESNTSYHILIDTEAIIDPAGNAFAGIDDPEVFAFTTGDFESPEVTFTPEHLSEDIAVDADLVIGFSEPITIEADGGITDENVVSLIDFKSSPPYDQEQEEGDWEDVAFDAVINASADTITLTLPDDGDGNPTLLLGNRFYNMEIDEAIMDEVGNSIDPSPQFSRFLTAATDAPTVEVSTEVESPTNTSPIAVAIEFSEAVTEFNSDSLSLSGGDIESFSGEEASYSVSITPSEGEVSVQVEGDKGFNEFDTGNAASNKLVLIYDITSPIVTFAPADSTLDASLASKVYITFSEPVFTDNGAPVVLSDLTGSVSVRKDSIDGEVQSFGMAYNDTTGVIKLTPPDSLISAVDYYVAITAEVYDEAGNPFAGDSSYFKAEDIDPPTITLVPADGATDVAVDTYMRVIFSERVYSETGEKFEDFDVSEGMVVVRVDNASGSILNIGVQISPDTSALTIQTDELLKGEQTYHVQVNPRFADLNGTVVEKTTATFTTVDVIPPEIALTPDLGEQDVSPETELSISFSESVRLIDNSIMTAENVKDLLYVNLWNPEGEAIDFTVSVNAARDEISIVPSAILPPFEKIVFGLTDGLEDYSENLAGSAAGYFFTAGIPGFDISPRSGITTTETGLSDTFEVVLTSEPEYPVSFNIMSTDVTEGMSYPTQLTFTRDNWDQKQWVKVTGVDDPDADDDMTYHIKLFNITSDDPEYNGMEADSATCVNINDDPPGIKVYPISRLITTEEGKQAQFGIVLLSRPTATVTIPVSTSDVTEASVDVTQLVFDAEEWDQKQLVTLTGLDDDEDDDDIEYKIVLGESVSEDADYSAVDPTDILAINIDDDVAGFALGYDRIVRTNEMGTDTVFTVKLNTEPAGTVALSVSSDDATEGTVSHDYLTFTPADWNVVQEVTVTGLNDNLGDGDLYYNIMVGEAIVTASPAYGRLDAKEVKAVNLDREPQITTGSEFMSFDSSGIGIPDSASVYVLNVGPDTLVIAGVSVNDSAFSAMIAPSPIKSGDSSLVRVFFNPEQAGKKQSVLYVEHNDPYQFPKELLISASVRDKSGPAIIELESMPTTAAVGEGVEVTVHVLDVTGVFDIGLYYGNGIGNFDFTKMTEDSSGIYSGNIPTGIANLTGLVYFIVATDTKGNITYSDTVSVPVQFGDKQLSTDVSGSAYPSGISKDAWRLISVPNLIDENKATQIFGNELKDRNKRSWRLVSDFVSKETWQDVKEITPGMGMWLYQQVKDNVSISTGTGTTSDLSRHELTVRSGWSIIGSPYAFTFAADIDGEIFSGPFAYALDGVEGWSDVVTQFQPWAGYIIKNLTLEEQTLVLRPLASAGTDSTLKREIAGKQIGWTVNLAALSGRVGDLYNKMGRQPGASESIGPFDHAEPPIMPGGISLAFRQGNGRSLMYARDMRSMAEHNGAWPMDLMVKDIKEPISFTVELDEHYPLNLGLVILDHQTREVTDLREDPDLKIHHSNEDIPYRFTVVSGDGDYIIRKVEEILAGIPERFSLGQNYPNPFNSTTTIRYALPLPEFVNITIYNILGQEVHKMVGSWQEAGFHTARWDGRDLHGIPVSSGVYIYHIQAGKFMSARKMAIIK